MSLENISSWFKDRKHDVPKSDPEKQRLGSFESYEGDKSLCVLWYKCTPGLTNAFKTSFPSQILPTCRQNRCHVIAAHEEFSGY